MRLSPLGTIRQIQPFLAGSSDVRLLFLATNWPDVLSLRGCSAVSAARDRAAARCLPVRNPELPLRLRCRACQSGNRPVSGEAARRMYPPAPATAAIPTRSTPTSTSTAPAALPSTKSMPGERSVKPARASRSGRTGGGSNPSQAIRIASSLASLQNLSNTKPTPGAIMRPQTGCNGQKTAVPIIQPSTRIRTQPVRLVRLSCRGRACRWRVGLGYAPFYCWTPDFRSGSDPTWRHGLPPLRRNEDT